MTADRSTSNPISDVRMRGFARRTTVANTLVWLDDHLQALPPESVPLAELAGRVLARDIVSQVDVPAFARSMMDGYAVVANDTLGASSYNRLALQVVGEVLPGQPPQVGVKPGQAVRIMTGAALPAGADAVLPVEKVAVEKVAVEKVAVEKVPAEGERIFAQDAVPPGKNVGRIGEDIPRGSTLLQSGRRLRPQDVGVLSSIGITVADVVRQPRVRIVVTGNELLPPGSVPRDFQIVDANSPMLAALIARDGGLPINPGIIADDPESILEAMRDDADIVLVSGGSSVGKEDHAPVLLRQQGNLAIHGIAMRPSSPAGMGTLDERLVFLLPGNPVSCLCAYDFFAGRAIRVFAGNAAEWPYRQSQFPLRRKLVSTVGRLDYARVKLIDGQAEPLAISGASVLSSTTRADGFVVVEDDCEGYPDRAVVTVHLYDLF
ncbi:MAG TPA: gephyrin-like molybdotransferase Glp [Pirellulaceae bacterium]|nr:gephyrin-like molybdotransferase Glp [Pirellulaceae bacterium]